MIAGRSIAVWRVFLSLRHEQIPSKYLIIDTAAKSRESFCGELPPKEIAE
jgi:hypothetical protein